MLLPIFIFSPLFAYAGFFSLSTIFGDNNPQTVGPEQKKLALNSQTMNLLQAAINLDPDPAKGGADISTVEGKALVAETGIGGSFVEISEKKNSKIAVYEVKEGDTLSQISDMFQVSMNTIRWANDFTGDIHPGQKLVILPITGVRHTVKEGGTIDDIAKIYNADSREIALFNGIPESKKLETGDEIIVPYAEKETPKVISNKKLASNASEKSSSKSSWASKTNVWIPFTRNSWI
jgi:LysM repeat protein